MTSAQILDLANRLNIDAREIELAIRLARSARTDLLTKVIDGKMTLASAIYVLRTGKPQP